MLAGPAQAQLLVIPAAKGADACLEGNSLWSEFTGSYAITVETTPTQNAVRLGTPVIRLSGIRTDTGDTDLAEASVSLALQESGINTPLQAVDLGTVSQSDLAVFINAGTNDFTNLKKNTRYVAILYTRATNDRIETIFSRTCFKTRGEFTTAEQNLVLSQGTWVPNLARYNRTGCYAVASTRQDIRDCYCNGKRNGTHILAGQTVASQAQRQYLNCPDLDS